MRPFCKNFVAVISLLVTLTSCQLNRCELRPVITTPTLELKSCDKPSAFLPLDIEDKATIWGSELEAGNRFAKEDDLYRAITCFKKSKFLLEVESDQKDLLSRLQQVDYNIILAYYLAKKYPEAIIAFENSSLTAACPTFPAFRQLLLMMFECYLQVKDECRANFFKEKIAKAAPDTAADLALYQSLYNGEISCGQSDPDIDKELALYCCLKKSPSKARVLNAILPGAGYYYVGEKKSAVTSFIINTLFTYASYRFFKTSNVAAGLITASLEGGWYFGGINGAGIDAQEYNNRLYTSIASKTLKNHFCFPILTFDTVF